MNYARSVVSLAVTAIVSAALGLGVVTLACNQEQIPVNPVPGYPCGTSGYYFECYQGCCWRGTACGVKGHACGLGDCCFVGDNFGASPDAGIAHELAPEEARRREALEVRP